MSGASMNESAGSGHRRPHAGSSNEKEPSMDTVTWGRTNNGPRASRIAVAALVAVIVGLGVGVAIGRATAPSPTHTITHTVYTGSKASNACRHAVDYLVR